MSDNKAMQAELEALRARNAELEAKVLAKNTVTCKVSAKKAMSIYGLGRFPFTFYRSQWEVFSKELPKINAFFEAHKAEFATKE